MRLLCILLACSGHRFAIFLYSFVTSNVLSAISHTRPGPFASQYIVSTPQVEALVTIDLEFVEAIIGRN